MGIDDILTKLPTADLGIGDIPTWLSTADMGIDDILAKLSTADLGIGDIPTWLSTADMGIDDILTKLSTADLGTDDVTSTASGVARASPGGRVAHPESQNEEENK